MLFWKAYRKCKGRCPKKFALELPAAFVRTACALKVCKDLAKDDLKLEKVEQKLREKLGPVNLPEAFLKSKEVATPAPTKNSAKSNAIVPDNLPPLDLRRRCGGSGLRGLGAS